MAPSLPSAPDSCVPARYRAPAPKSTAVGPRRSRGTGVGQIVRSLATATVAADPLAARPRLDRRFAAAARALAALGALLDRGAARLAMPVGERARGEVRLVDHHDLAGLAVDAHHRDGPHV